MATVNVGTAGLREGRSLETAATQMKANGRRRRTAGQPENVSNNCVQQRLEIPCVQQRLESGNIKR